MTAGVFCQGCHVSFITTRTETNQNLLIDRHVFGLSHAFAKAFFKTKELFTLLSLNGKLSVFHGQKVDMPKRV